MKILKYTKLKNNQYKLSLDNGVELNLYEDLILKENLLLTKEITTKEVEKILELNNYYAAYYKALKLINGRLRCEKELVTLLKKDYNQSIIKQVIKTLKSTGYLNNKVYITSYIHDALLLSLKGPLKIKRELLNLDFPEEEVDNLFKIEDKVWEERINKYLQKKLKISNNLSNLKLKQKLINDLSNLGYSKNMIIESLDKVSLPNDLGNLKKDYEKIKKQLERKNMENNSSKIISKLLQKGYLYEDIKNIVD